MYYHTQQIKDKKKFLYPIIDILKTNQPILNLYNIFFQTSFRKLSNNKISVFIQKLIKETIGSKLNCLPAFYPL
jgi:hypothetical protein